MVSHLDYDLYGEVDHTAINEVANASKDFDKLVWLVFQSEEGQKLFKEFDKSLAKSVFNTDTHMMAYSEGQRGFIIALKEAYNRGETNG